MQLPTRVSSEENKLFRDKEKEKGKDFPVGK